MNEVKIGNHRGIYMDDSPIISEAIITMAKTDRGEIR